jgi:hypothetical protein
VEWHLYNIRPERYPRFARRNYRRNEPEINYALILKQVISDGAHGIFNRYLRNRDYTDYCRCGQYWDPNTKMIVYPPTQGKTTTRRLMGLHDVEAFITEAKAARSHRGPWRSWDPQHNPGLFRAMDKFVKTWIEKAGHILDVQVELKV